jgi:hypothetical protein
MDVAAFDRSQRFNAAQGRLGRSQGPEALMVSQQPFDCGVVALDQGVLPFSVDMSDAVEMRIISAVFLSDDQPTPVGFVCDNRYGSVEPDALDGLAQEGPGRLCVSSCGQADVNDFAIRIDRPSQVAPFAADADLGLIHMPVDACTAQMFLCSLRQFWAKLLDPAEHSRSVNSYAALCQQINHVLIRQRVTQVPTHRVKYDIARKAVVLDPGLVRHHHPQKSETG